MWQTQTRHNATHSSSPLAFSSPKPPNPHDLPLCPSSLCLLLFVVLPLFVFVFACCVRFSLLLPRAKASRFSTMSHVTFRHRVHDTTKVSRCPSQQNKNNKKKQNNKRKQEARQEKAPCCCCCCCVLLLRSRPHHTPHNTRSQHGCVCFNEHTPTHTHALLSSFLPSFFFFFCLCLFGCVSLSLSICCCCCCCASSLPHLTRKHKEERKEQISPHQSNLRAASSCCFSLCFFPLDPSSPLPKPSQNKEGFGSSCACVDTPALFFFFFCILFCFC